MSSQEAEWYAACDAAKTAKFLRNFFQELELLGINEPIPLLEDNKGCIDFSVKTIATSQMKHIDLRYHFLRDYLRRGIVKFYKVNTNDNISDIFTKALAITKFTYLRSQMKVKSKPEFFVA